MKTKYIAPVFKVTTVELPWIHTTGEQVTMYGGLGKDKWFKDKYEDNEDELPAHDHKVSCAG